MILRFSTPVLLATLLMQHSQDEAAVEAFAPQLIQPTRTTTTTSSVPSRLGFVGTTLRAGNLDDDAYDNDDDDEEDDEEDYLDIDSKSLSSPDDLLNKLEKQFNLKDATPAVAEPKEDLHIQSSHSSSSVHKKQSNKNDYKAPSADDLRTRFEMQWQMKEQTEECDVYQPSSCGGKPCDACHGTGKCPCRFCRGTGFVYMQLPSSSSSSSQSPQQQMQRKYEESMFGGNLNSLLQDEPSSSFTPCCICNQAGEESCKQCRGSGWIAGWTNINLSAKP